MLKKYFFDISAFVGCIVRNETKLFNSLLHVMALPFIAIIRHRILVTNLEANTLTIDIPAHSCTYDTSHCSIYVCLKH
jgi:hypothetical protein